jgi:TetR/AcrR family transcriptional regulator, ethionamide resistance regulator
LPPSKLSGQANGSSSADPWRSRHESAGIDSGRLTIAAKVSSPPVSGGRRSDPLDRRHIHRRQLNTRRLLPAVERLLEHATYPELTVEQMVAEADISRSTFYNYFEDKGDLLRALTRDVMSTITDATRTWWMLPPDASKQELRAALAHLFQVYDPHAALMRAVAESLSHDQRVREEFLEYMTASAKDTANYIRDGQRAGAFRASLDASWAAEWLVWMFERGLSWFGGPLANDEPEGTVDAVTELVWKALH